MNAAALSGFTLGLSLIVAIGAQNAFILRQGLLRQYVFILCLICAISDAVLIMAGVAGLGTLIAQSPLLIKLVSIGGAGFLFWYGFSAFRRAMKPDGMQVSETSVPSLKIAVSICLALTFLNPHVYLDTVVLVGSLSARFPEEQRLVYGIGAMTASFVWFFALGYGARLLQPLFAKPAAWRILDCIIGVIMWAIALSLLSRLAIA